MGAWSEARHGVKPVARASRWNRVLMIAVIALSSGAVMATIAGARRTVSSYDRLLEWADPPDVTMGGGEGQEVKNLPAALEASRVVKRFSVGHLVSAAVQIGDAPPLAFEELFAVALPDDGRRFKLLRGRPPDPNSATEAIVSNLTSDRLGIEPDDHLTLVTDDGKRIGIDVTAVVATPGEFPSVGGRVFSTVGLGEAFAAEHPDLLNPDDTSTSVWLVDGSDSLDEFRAEGERLGFTSIDVDEQIEVSTGVNRLVRVEAVALLAAGFVAGLAGFVVAYQLFRRGAAATSSDLRTLQALGVTPRGFMTGGAILSFELAGAGTVIGAAMALASSLITPFGTARIAEPDPGVRADPSVLFIGMMLILLVAVAVGAAVFGRVSRMATPARFRASRPPIPLPEPAGSGVRFALGPTPDGRRFAPILGLGLVVAILVAVAGIGSALAAVGNDAALSGGWWDGFIADFDGNSGALAATIAQSSDVESSVRGGWIGETRIDGGSVGVMIVDSTGDLQPTMSAGRVPQTPTEVALGRALMERVGVGIGDKISFDIDNDDGESVAVTLDVVGETVFAAPQWFTMAPGEGALVDVTFGQMLQPRSSQQDPFYLVRLRDGADAPAAMQAIAANVPPASDGSSSDIVQFARSPRSDVEALSGIAQIPFVLAAELALLVIASLAHQALSSARQHRRDLAVLRSLGFTPAQSVGASVAQAGTFAMVALVIGLPLGLLLGSILWKQIARQLVVIPQVSVAIITLAAVTVGCFVIAIAVGVGVGRRTLHVSVAADLRDE